MTTTHTYTYAENTWPKRIYVEQDGIGIRQVTIYDADTHEQMTAVMSIVMSHYDNSMVTVTQSKYTPAKPVAVCAWDDPDLMLPSENGIVCTTHIYPIVKLSLTAGISPE